MCVNVKFTNIKGVISEIRNNTRNLIFFLSTPLLHINIANESNYIVQITRRHLITVFCMTNSGLWNT